MMSTFSDIAVKVALTSFILALLPESPFVGFTSLMSSIPYVNWLNWFLPIPEILAIMEAWLAVVTVYYGMLYILNYVGVLKS